MSRTAYVDESERSQLFLMVMVVVPASSNGELDRVVRSLRMPNQRRLHLSKENDSRLRAIVAALAAKALFDASIFIAPQPAVQARDRCLRKVVEELARNNVRRLILDRVDDEQLTRDRISIYETVHKLDADLSYEHAESRMFAGLQAADVTAWAYGAGGHWRQTIQARVKEVICL